MMPVAVPQEVVAGTLGIDSYWSGSSSFGGAGIAGAIQAASNAITLGQASVVISYFGIDWGRSPGAAYGAMEASASPADLIELPHGFYGQPTHFAAIARRYASEHGVDLDDLLGPIAVQHRRNAIANGAAQRMEPLSLEDYLALDPISEPLRVPDCCILTDGAAAIVMTAADRAEDLPTSPAHIRGAAVRGSRVGLDDFFSQNPDYLSLPPARAAVTEALSSAGASLDDVDVAELYDCFTISVVMQLESIGWCRPGTAIDLVAGGAGIAVDGQLPLNTHGGLLSHSYLLGMSHVVECVRQVRGTAAHQVADVNLGLVGLLSASHYGAVALATEPTS